MSSSKRWTSAELPGRTPLTPVLRSPRRSVSRSDLASLTRTLWPSSSAISRNGNKSPSPAVASSPSATLADHLAKDGRSLCWHHRSFAKDDADARKIGKSSGKPDRRHAHPGPHRAVRLRGLAFRVGVQRRVHPEDVQAPLAAAPAHELLPPARLHHTQWALSPGRRSGSPTMAAVPETNKCNKKGGLISLGWGHLFNRRKHATDDASLAAAASTLLSSPVSSRMSCSRGGGEAGHQMKMAHCNARAGSVSNRSLAAAEVELMGTWVSVSEMRGKVARKRVQLDKEMLKMKLNAVFSSQMKFLESWEHMETKHASALDSTVACARAAVCRLPPTNGAKVSMQSLASTLQHVLELVITTKTTTRPFGSKALETTSVVSELARVAREEQALLQECLELLSRFSSLQVEEQSLRCHLVQSGSGVVIAY